MRHRTRDEHLFAPGPKRILALDGGGVRGILTLSYLSRIEELLSARYGQPGDFRLSDYFDVISGTSVGAITAAALALGFSVHEIQALFKEVLPKVFKRSLRRPQVLMPKFDAKELAKILQQHFGDTTLGSEEIRTGLMIVTKRLDTGSTWVLHNNPRGKFYGEVDDTASMPNRNFLLRQVVRASAAAPYYFKPERIRIDAGEKAPYGAFVDGGVSPFNNPALQALLFATLRGYGLSWPLGADNLILISVGTGYRKARLDEKTVMGLPAAQVAMHSILSIMTDCDLLNQTLLQWISRCPSPWLLDSEIGDLRDDLFGGREWLSYVRYNVVMNSDWVFDNLGIELSEHEAERLAQIDNVVGMDRLEGIGAIAANVQVSKNHYPPTFDVD